MKSETSKVTVHMVSSLDGFVAKKDESVSWLQSKDHYHKGVTLSEAEIDEFIKNIDCYVMGSRTYEHAMKLGWPYGNVPVIVLTNRDLTTDRESVQFYSGDLQKLVHEKLATQHKNIWVVGGSKVVKGFIKMGLVDEIILSIMPVLLGNGTLFFDYLGQEHALHLKDVTAYQDGMVELCYEINKDNNK